MKHSVRHYLFKLKWLLATAIFVVFVGFVGENCLMNRWEQKKEISRLKSEIDEQNRKFERDRVTLERLKNNPDAIKEVARERYFMKTDDEDVFVFQDED
ncbi:MAG: septum formation initiator family protein [Bacteroidaceae bacterium]|nr:septum formation initiator family protein [Bacteroidaceae bacterium]